LERDGLKSEAHAFSQSTSMITSPSGGATDQRPPLAAFDHPRNYIPYVIPLDYINIVDKVLIKT